MELWHAVILGLVEGITEYLPISSTGHLILTGELLGLKNGPAGKALDDFSIVIQGGAILAVAGLYFPRFVEMLRGLIGRSRAGLGLVINILIAFLPSAILGFFAHDWIEARLFSVWPVTAALALGGVYMIAMERRHRRLGHGPDPSPSAAADLGIDQLTRAQAFKIGLLQCAALWPGVSRSMMTITGGYLVGLRPARAAEFSFLLGVPTLLAAAGYSLLKNLLHARKTGGPNLFEAVGVGPCVVGMLVAAVSAAVAVRWLVGFLNRHGLAPFGLYRLGLAIVLAGLWLTGLVQVRPS
jgi:undecaprenyl-diphosphatase